MISNVGHGKRILFCINTPAQAYFWQGVIKDLMRKGHNIKILARDSGLTTNILSSNGLDYSILNTFKSKQVRLLSIINHLYKGYGLSKRFDPITIIGFGVAEALTSALAGKPSIIFTDSEPMFAQTFLTKLFASVIVTPNCFTKNLGSKHIRIDGYKELAYLHPNYFKPDPTIYDELKLNHNEKYVLLRFSSFEALHDSGKHGFSIEDKEELVNKLEKNATVFISAERGLPNNLQRYKLPTQPNKIHHVLYYAQMVVGDSQTTTTEAAVLGTPAIRCNSFVGPNDMGNFIELEQKYNLIFSLSDPDQAIQKAVQLIQQTDIKEQWAEKRQKLLADKIDVTKFMIDIIENFPNSVAKYRRKNGSL